MYAMEVLTGGRTLVYSGSESERGRMEREGGEVES